MPPTHIEVHTRLRPHVQHHEGEGRQGQQREQLGHRGGGALVRSALRAGTNEGQVETRETRGRGMWVRHGQRAEGGAKGGAGWVRGRGTGPCQWWGECVVVGGALQAGGGEAAAGPGQAQESGVAPATAA